MREVITGVTHSYATRKFYKKPWFFVLNIALGLQSGVQVHPSVPEEQLNPDETLFAGKQFQEMAKIDGG